MTERCSVVIPTRNRAHFLAQAIDSVLAQSFAAHEIIVVDDASEDDTAAVLAGYADRVRALRQPLAGHAAARNRGIDAASGEYIAFLDDDDLWLPDKLERQMAYLSRNQDVVLLGTGYAIIDSHGEPIIDRAVSWELLTTGPMSFSTVFFQCPLLTSTLVARRDTLVQVGMFDDSIRFGADQDLWIRIALAGPVHFLRGVWTQYRIFDRNTHTTLLTDPNLVEAWLDQALRSKDKAYACWPSDAGDVATVRSRVTATHLARAAMLHFYHGQDVAGHQRLLEACATYPSEWCNARAILPLVLEFGRFRARREGITEARRWAGHVLALAPLPLRASRAARRRVVGELLADHAFHAYGHANGPAALTCALAAIRVDPRWVRNRGLLAIAGRSILRRRAPAI